MEVNDDLKQFYQECDEDGRLTSKHGKIEYITTMKYIERYLRPGMRVLEIGAATGRYSHALARMGYSVDAVELIEHNIEIFKRNTIPGELVTITQGNAMDLSAFESDAYDITLLLGPMYHLYTRADKLKALSEAIRVTKEGGIVFVAYCGNDAAILQFCFLRGMLKDGHYKKLVDPVTFKADSDPAELFELHRKEDVDELRAGFPVTQLHYVAADGFAHYMRQTLAEMDDELYQQYINYHLATCERQDMVGYSNHTLDIFRKDELKC